MWEREWERRWWGLVVGLVANVDGQPVGRKRRHGAAKKLQRVSVRSRRASRGGAGDDFSSITARPRQRLRCAVDGARLEGARYARRGLGGSLVAGCAVWGDDASSAGGQGQGQEEKTRTRMPRAGVVVCIRGRIQYICICTHVYVYLYGQRVMARPVAA